MQAALLMTEELLGFLVRPSYYRKLICKHTLHRSHEPRRDATGRDTSFGSRGHWNRIRTVGRRSMQNVFSPQRQPRYRTSVALADSD